MQGNLTLKQCHAAGPGRHRDGLYGLYLLVKPNGRKSWTQAVRINGKRTDLGLGPFPVVPLSEARDTALSNLRDIRHGLDPRKPKKKEVLAITFSEAAEAAIQAEAHKSKDPDRYLAQNMQMLRKHAFPLIGDRPVNEVDTPEILRILHPLSEAGRTWKTISAPISKVIQWSELQQIRPLHSNPVPLVVKSLDRKPHKHHASLHADDLAERLRAYLQGSTSKRETINGVLLLAVTGARIGSVENAEWDEFDFDRLLWTAASMKGGKHTSDPFDYPLPWQVAERVADQASKRFMTTDAMRASIKRFGIPTPHGIRNSMTDWARRRGDVPKDVQEALLAHKDTKLRQAYARDTLIDLRRPITQKWADFLLQEPKKPVGGTLDRFFDAT